MKELRFTARTLDGACFDGRSLANKPAVVWFWASWCPVCAATEPQMPKLAQRLSAEGGSVLGIAGLDSPVEDARGFVARNSMTNFVNVDDLDGSIWHGFQVTEQDQIAYLGPHGVVGYEDVSGGLDIDAVAGKARAAATA